MMCDPCAAEHQRWLDYRMPPAPIALISIGDSLAEVSRRRTARFEEWRRTIRTQQELIRTLCAQGKHVQPKA